MWAKTSRFGIGGLLGVLLLAGCGGSKPSNASNPSSSASSYPAQYKEAFFKAHECGQSNGYSVANCECQIRYVEAHAPYKALEEGSSEHAKAEEALNQAGSTCSEESHTPAEEAAHNSAVEGQQKYNKAYSEQEQKDKPEEEQLQKDKEKVEYEDGG